MAKFLVCAWFVAAAWVCCQAHRSDVRSVTPNRYLRFHANDSYVGLPVPCTEREKLCFRLNMLSYEVWGRIQCYQLNTFTHVNKTELLSGSGRVVIAEAAYSYPCLGQGGEVLAFDGECYKRELVRDVICACEGEADSDVARNPTTTHLFGDEECRCDRTIPTHIAQPEEPGRCLIPHLNFPDAVYAPFAEEQGFSLYQYGVKKIFPPVGLQCDEVQLRCFRLGQVAFRGSCVQLLKQGPCPADHVVALDVTAAQKGHVETTCVHVRGNCPLGHLRMTFDGRCYSEGELEAFFNPFIGPNQFGLTIIIRDHGPPQFTPQVFKGSLCRVNVTLSIHTGSFGGGGGGEPAGTPANCSPTDDNNCDLNRVRAEPPEPDP